ncbi:penicillin acylase family protein, partial [Escherichia coli]|nr:penicillin acylase family protein [Escherichia coli]
DKRRQLMPTASPLDVIIVGSDQQRGRPLFEQSSRVEVVRTAISPSASLLAEMRRATVLARRSLERVGLYVEDLAASNNWVVSGKRTTSG